MRVLIADDEVISRRVLESTLKKWGYEVVATCDGEGALAALQSEGAPPLAILDVMMPGMDGVEVCRGARRLARETPAYLILLTSKTDRESILQGLQAGADDYITKPFDRDELYARVQVGARVAGLQQALAERTRKLELAEAELRSRSSADRLTGSDDLRGQLS